MNTMEIEKKAIELKGRVGGKIFAFPVNEQDPFSKYAVTMFTGEDFKTFPDALDISEAASGIQQILHSLKEEGLDSDYERLVRFVSYEAQINAPSVTMRRLKKENTPKKFLQEGIDITPTDDGYNFSARGLIKFSYLQMIDDDLPKAGEFMNEYYKLLAVRKYGKTAAAIKQEVRRMDKATAIGWIERTYSRFITDDMEVMNIMQLLRK